MGLLAKAEAYLQWEAEQRIAAERKMAEEQMALAAAAEKRKAKIEAAVKHVTAGIKTTQVKLTHVANDFKAKFQTAIKKAYQPQLRRYAAMLLGLGLSLQVAEPRTMDNQNLAMQQLANWHLTPQVEVTVPNRPAPINYDNFVNIFPRETHHSIFTEQDRDDLARLLYGEAGVDLLDNIEVLHAALNRYASPLFKGTLRDILTAKNQFIGFKSNHPVLPELRLIVDEVVNDFEANGCQEICNHFYFVTYQQGICNKHEISPAGSHGAWVKASAKVYEEPNHGCPTAMRQCTKISKKLSQIPTQRVRIRGYERSI